MLSLVCVFLGGIYKNQNIQELVVIYLCDKMACISWPEDVFAHSINSEALQLLTSYLSPQENAVVVLCNESLALCEHVACPGMWHVACQNRCKRVLILLHRQYSIPSAVRERGYTYLVRTNDLEMVRFYVDRNFVDDASMGLSVAVQFGHEFLVRWFLAQVPVTTSDVDTALWYAVWHDHVKILRLLLVKRRTCTGEMLPPDLLAVAVVKIRYAVVKILLIESTCQPMDTSVLCKALTIQSGPIISALFGDARVKLSQLDIVVLQTALRAHDYGIAKRLILHSTYDLTSLIQSGGSYASRDMIGCILEHGKARVNLRECGQRLVKWSLVNGAKTIFLDLIQDKWIKTRLARWHIVEWAIEGGNVGLLKKCLALPGIYVTQEHVARARKRSSIGMVNILQEHCPKL